LAATEATAWPARTEAVARLAVAARLAAAEVTAWLARTEAVARLAVAARLAAAEAAAWLEMAAWLETAAWLARAGAVAPPVWVAQAPQAALRADVTSSSAPGASRSAETA
jgi:hypothetical protein